MLQQIDLDFLRRLAAPSDLGGVSLLLAVFIAEVGIAIIPLTLAGLWVLGEGKARHAAVAAGLAGLLALGAAGLISSYIDRPRPFVSGLARNYLHHAADSSVPSDHAAVLFGVAFALWAHRQTSHNTLAIPIFFVAFLVAWARIFLGAHYPSDVLAGAAVGFGAALLVCGSLGDRAVVRLTALGERLYSAPLRFLPRRRS